MLTQGFIDLDELILLCRNENARDFIQEAVQCYKAGAFRQTIVATWIAVVYDIIYKLQELELTGDKNATQHLEQFEKIRKSNDLRGSLEFERQILGVAKEEFELITEIEYIDLSRLQEDRNRCAHPAMNVNDEIYKPSPELARAHLRNAIEHILQRPPVQGKAALKRLLSDIESEYFPTNMEDAIKYFSAGPLLHPKPSLVRNFIIILTKELMASNIDPRRRVRFLCALNATIQIQRGISQATLAVKLNDIVIQLPDTELISVLRYIVDVDDTWQLLGNDSKERLKVFVRNLPSSEEALGLYCAFKITDLESDAIIRVESVNYLNLISIVTCLRNGIHPKIVETAVCLYIKSENYSQANSIGTELIIPLANTIPKELIEPIIRASSENRQIRDSFQRRTVLQHLRCCEIIQLDLFNTLLRKYNVDDLGLQEENTDEWENND